MKKRNMALAEVKNVFPALNNLSDQIMADKIARAWIEAWEISSWDRIEDAWLTPETEEQIRLVDHVNCIAELSPLVSGVIKKYHPDIPCDTELLIQLALMHDVSKLYEFEPDGMGGCRHSDYSKLYQHAIGSYTLAVKHEMPEKLVHLIYAHADCCPIEPQYMEGHLFAHLDHSHFAMAVWGKTGTAKFKKSRQSKMLL